MKPDSPLAPFLWQPLLTTLHVVQHYAVKTVENVTLTRSKCAASFACKAVVTSLVRTMQTARSGAVRAAAASATGRLLRKSQEMLEFYDSTFSIRVLLPGLLISTNARAASTHAREASTDLGTS